MTYTAMLLIIIPIAMILGGILLLKKTAKKFDISKKDLKKINQRNRALDQKEQDDDRY